MNKKQLKHYKSFFDDNENGGSSRWLVSPDTVEMFIDTMLEEQRKEIVKGIIDMVKVPENEIVNAMEMAIREHIIEVIKNNLSKH